MRRKRDKTAPRGGAVLRPSVTVALTKALFSEWAKTGYGALSLETVAQRAGVGKAALYRRWPSKLAMVIDCLEQIDLTALPAAPDTGSLTGDVRALLADLRSLLGHKLIRRILPDVQAEMLRSAELANAVRGRLQAQYRGNATAILKRALVRGEIAANLDLDLAADALVSLLYWRMVVNAAEADDKYLDRLAGFLIAALARSKPSH